MDNNKKYDIFISGETIDLVIPNEIAIEEDNWHSWFNDSVITRYLKYGIFPNSKEIQYQVLNTIRSNNNDKLVLLVLPKNSDKIIGITHLAGIDQINRSAHFGLILGRDRPVTDICPSLEVKARMTEHGFEMIGLERIWGAQVTNLEMWQRYQVLLGYRPEGITRKSFRKGRIFYDEIITSCIFEDYLDLKNKRNGAYWPGRKKMLQLIRTIPKASIIDMFNVAINHVYYEYIEHVKLY